jgi:hypothetical protein
MTIRSRTAEFFHSHRFSVLSALVSIVALAVAVVSLWVAFYLSSKIIEHRFCGVLHTMIAKPSHAPKSSYGQAIDQRAREYATSIGCRIR